MLQSINPFTQKLIKEYQEDSLDEIKAKAIRSSQAYLQWKALSFAERGKAFEKLASILFVKKESLAKLITEEMGKPYLEALGEIDKCILGIKYYAEHAEALLKPTPLKSDASESYLTYEPIGTVLALMPWNFPFWQTIRCAAPAMMAGNTILLKLSPNTTGCALAIESCFAEAGFPDGSFQTLKIQNETSSFVIQQKEIKAISLTGSERAGVIVASEAGKNLKKVVLELGGSDPFIVLADADIDYAIDFAIKGRLQNTGQSCIAAKRFILDKTISKVFIEKLSKKIAALTSGDPINSATNIGPMARLDLKKGLVKQVKDSIQKGATLVYGKLNESETNFFEPIILTNIKPGMPAYEEEFFGPVFSIIEAAHEHEAIHLANDTPYGLGASIWTKDITKAKNLASKIESGMVFINDFVRSDIRLPFGGVKLSGYGRELGEAGIKEFVNVKTIYVK